VPPPPDQGDASGVELLAGEHCDTNELRVIGVKQGSTITPLHGVAGMTGHPLAIPETLRIATPCTEAEGAALDRSATASDTVPPVRTTVPGESAACLRWKVCPSGGEFVRHLTVIVQEPMA